MMAPFLHLLLASTIVNMALTLENAPTIGVYKTNYRDDITHIIAEGINTEVTLPPLKFEDHTWEGKSLQLICNASYPVVWRYNGNGAPAVHTLTYRRLVSDTDLVYQFSAAVVFTHTNTKQTGNYTCESVENPGSFHSYVYVFVPGDALFLTDIEETETVSIRKHEAWVTLPCSVSAANVTAILFKKGPGDRVEVLKQGTNLAYDSKIGFLMKWTAYLKPTGTYFCVAQNNRNLEQLEIEVNFAPKSEARLKNVAYSSSRPSPKKRVRFIVDRINNRIACCSATNKRPFMKYTGCSSPSDCELRRKYLEAKRCPPTCDQDIANVGKTCVAYYLGDWSNSGILQCTLDESDSSQSEYFVFSKRADTIITNFTAIPPVSQILQIFVQDSPNSDKLYISCHAHPFFFSHGLKWGVKTPLGHFEFLAEAHYPASTTIEVDKSKNVGNEFYCFAPIWDSPNDWRNTAILIK